MPVCSTCHKEVKVAKLCSNCGALLEQIVETEEKTELDAPLKAEDQVGNQKYSNQSQISVDNPFVFALISLAVQPLGLGYLVMNIYHEGDLGALLGSMQGMLVLGLLVAEFLLIWRLYNLSLTARLIQVILSLILMVIIMLLMVFNFSLIALSLLFINVYSIYILLFRGFTKLFLQG